MVSTLEQRNILLSKIMYNSFQIMLVLLQIEKRRKERSCVHEQGERTETRQQNTQEHTPNKKLKAL